MTFGKKLLALAGLCTLAVAVAAAQNQNNPPASGTKPGANRANNQPGQPGQAGQNGPRFDAARFVKDHDKNNDGKLSKDELPSAAQNDFARIDANGDGFVSPDELQQHAARMSSQRPQLVEVVWYAIDVPEERITLQELQTAYDQLRTLDKNHDGKIDEGEVKALRERRHQDRLNSVFQTMDRNGDGKISKDEARGVWIDNFQQLDKNNDGMLDRQEVEAACRQHQQQQGTPGSGASNTGANNTTGSTRR